jgi:hypothetical protein
MPVGDRRLLEPSELWPQEQRLCDKAAEGGLLDLRSRCPEEDDPARGRGWDPQRRIRAQVLADPDGNALNANGLVVEASMFLRKAQCTGVIVLVGARISGELDCTEAEFTNPGGLVVNLAQGTVAEAVYMHPASLTGGLNLIRARVGSWHDAQQTWPTTQDPPAELWLEGFVYDAINGEGASVDERLQSPLLPAEP